MIRDNFQRFNVKLQSIEKKFYIEVENDTMEVIETRVFNNEDKEKVFDYYFFIFQNEDMVGVGERIRGFGLIETGKKSPFKIKEPIQAKSELNQDFHGNQYD